MISQRAGSHATGTQMTSTANATAVSPKIVVPAEASRPDTKPAPSVGPTSNATNAPGAVMFERTRGAKVFGPANAEALLAQAEAALSDGNFAAANSLGNAVRKKLPVVPQLGIKAAFDLFRGWQPTPGIDSDKAIAEKIAGELAPGFDADVAKNRGFTYAAIKDFEERLTALSQGTRRLMIESEVRALAADTTLSPTAKADRADTLARQASNGMVKPEVIAQARSIYHSAIADDAKVQAALLDKDTAFGKANGLVAFGYARMYETGFTLAAIENAAAKSPDAATAVHASVTAYKAMLAASVDKAGRDLNALIDEAWKLPLDRALVKTDDDVAFAHYILRMAYARLDRSPEMLPFSMNVAHLQVTIAERAKGVIDDPNLRIGCVARDAASSLRWITTADYVTPIIREQAAKLAAQVQPLC
jgi:hypothetical protein